MDRKRPGTSRESDIDEKRQKPIEDVIVIDDKRSKPVESSLEYLRSLYMTTVPWRTNVAAKLALSAPYNFFLTRVKDVRDTFDEDLSITFWELLDNSLGEIEHVLFITYIADIAWLLAQFAVVGRPNPPGTLLYDSPEEENDMNTLPPHIKLKPIKIDNVDPFGHHHSKMMLFFYKDGSARVVVTTANLVESDWENRTQGVWISPTLPALAADAPADSGESVTHFRADLVKYLQNYNLSDISCWIDRLKKTDMSSVMVFLVTSIPGSHTTENYGYRQLRELLQEHGTCAESHSWSLIAQCSSIGSLGPTPGSWLMGAFGRALDEKSSKNVSVMVLYPSLLNVKTSLDGMLSGACLPYSSKTHARQKWLNDHLWQWKSKGRHRTRAIPHIKTYAKLSPNGTRAAWFLLTSANLSQAAWGSPTATGIRIKSHEVGVLFLPKFMTGESEFRVKTDGSFDKNEDFPFPYETPLTPYTSQDQMFFYDKCFK